VPLPTAHSTAVEAWGVTSLYQSSFRRSYCIHPNRFPDSHSRNIIFVSFFFFSSESCSLCFLRLLIIGEINSNHYIASYNIEAREKGDTYASPRKMRNFLGPRSIAFLPPQLSVSPSLTSTNGSSDHHERRW
jgi:hypothetical protein